MIKSLIRKLFFSKEKQHEVINNQKGKSNTNATSDSQLEKGKIQSILVPDFGGQKELILTKWHFKAGDIVKKGDIICEIESNNMTMEYEILYNGKIVSTCALNQKLTTGKEILKIEGI